jgi:hypothetical protein
MIGLKASAALAATLACFALEAIAQGTTPDPKTPATTTNAQPSASKKADPKKDSADKAIDAKRLETQKAAPKKADAKKDEPKKSDAKTAPPKKAAPKNAPAKKVDGKAKVTSQGGTVQKYEAGKAPQLKDAKGNTIPTSPDAYDISSATASPKKK